MNILKVPVLIAFACLSLGFKKSNEKIESVIDKSLAIATEHSINMAKSLEKDSMLLPRSYANEKLVTSDSRWWCSGFFPGVLWYLYENKPTPTLKNYAIQYTNRVEREKYTTDNHDVGFMIYCSFGNGLRILGTESYKDVIVKSSESLSTRYKDHMGLIRSWDQRPKEWQYPVIIDNLMNLEMLMWSSKYTGNKRFEEIAIKHADKTMKEHFRKDYSCYHLVDYDIKTGEPRLKRTVQGYSDSSAWARGQGWAVYGYTMMYRETKDKKYLDFAENIARYILTQLPEDKIPYWDFNAPNIPDAYRDASAGALIASAFIELSELTKDKKLSKACIKTAETQIRTLSSPNYLAKPNTNGNFILKHSVGSLPAKLEVDQPLTYADYYYVEALMRFKKLLNNKKS